jgi:hypothetical protein
MKTNFLAVVA